MSTNKQPNPLAGKETFRWNETKQFRDPVYGYIQVEVPYVHYLIDTSFMQRIKSVAQSGLRPLFAAATHDRFAHSVGVFRFAMLLFDSLQKNLKYEDLKEAGNGFREKLETWRNLLAIAALLHDIGHPIQSHSLEFLYDDIFLNFPSKQDHAVQRFDKNEQERIREIFKKYELGDPEISYKKSPFKQAMEREKSRINCMLQEHSEEIPGYLIAIDDSNYEGNPHERMSAYYILTEPELRDNIRLLCDSYNREKFPDGQNAKLSDAKHSDNLDFICRMITGTRYKVPTNSQADLEFSLRNCVIQILNGQIDADSMDYIMRNSYSSGYETSEVDYYRFCSALSVYREQNQFFPAWKKSALSVIEGFINARNYEPKWLYCHHKVVYQDVLVKEIMMYAAQYMALYPSEATKRARGNSDKLPNKFYHPFFTYMLSPVIPFSDGEHVFYRSVDGDMESLFKQLSVEMNQRKTILAKDIKTDNEKAEEALIDKYLELYTEHSTRKHKHSLWKSFAEYKHIIMRIARHLNTDTDTINRFVLELIEKGLTPEQFHLPSGSTEDGEEHEPTKGYVNEIIYYAPTLTTETSAIPQNFNFFIAHHARLIFSKFDPKTCRVKIVNLKVKDFSKEQVLLGNNMHYSLSEVLDLKYMQRPSFPFLYYRIPEGSMETPETLLKWFEQKLEGYCRSRITMPAVGGDIMFRKKDGIIVRDVVHGDIFLSNAYKAVVDTPEFQRLRRIKQLATATQVFPNAGHSRFSHSLGTYYVMTKIVEHFEKLCLEQGINLFHNTLERDVVLLSALLHDLGHGPYSHAFEQVLGTKTHEEWSQDIILNRKTRLNQVLRERFSQDAPELIVQCINHTISSGDIFSFADIYPTLVSSQLDADRLDYLMRDSYNTAIQFGNVDLQSIISAMRITVIDSKYTVAVAEDHLSMVEHFLFGRFKMYEMVYYNGYKLFSEGLLALIFKRVKKLIACGMPDFAKEIICGETGEALKEALQGIELPLDKYLRLDDTIVEAQFILWQDQKKDAILSMLSQAFLGRNHTLTDDTKKTRKIFRHVRVFHEEDAEIRDLLHQIETLLEREKVNMLVSGQSLCDVSYAFIDIMRYCRMYPGNDEENHVSSSDVIWLLRENGTVEDIKKVSNMLNDSFHKSYLYYSRDIFCIELKDCGLCDIQTDKILQEVDELMMAVHPRNMIEIEEKYSCNAQTLYDVENMLKTYTEEQQASHTGFYLEQHKNQFFTEISQTDTYYDLPGHQLYIANCSLRRREINGIKDTKYIFTIKRPTNSVNFGTNEQFARFEFEFESSTPDIDASILYFIRSHLNFEEFLKKPSVSDQEILETLKPQIKIENNRLKGTLLRYADNNKVSSFRAEICLDSLLYQRIPNNFLPLDIESIKRDWQIEIELKSDYLDRVLLKKFTSELRGQQDFSSRLIPESASKYEKARQLFGLC